MAKPITRTCPYCGGTGRFEVTGANAETLRALRHWRDEVSGAELARWLGNVKATAVNNRLAELERMGLATSRRCGARRLYRAKGVG